MWEGIMYKNFLHKSISSQICTLSHAKNACPFSCSSKTYKRKGHVLWVLCLEQAGERAHNRLNNAEKIFANITNQEQRYFKMLKYVKTQDKCDKTIFNSKIKSCLEIKNNDMY